MELSFGKPHPEIAAVGQPSDFYVFDIKNAPKHWSRSIKSSDGSQEFWHLLKKAKKEKDKETFQFLVDRIFYLFPPE